MNGPRTARRFFIAQLVLMVVLYVGEDDPTRGIPTFWKAAKLRFSDRAVQLLFDADAADVSVCLQGLYR